MGYEIKLLVIEPSGNGLDRLIYSADSERSFHVYADDEQLYYYDTCGDKKVYLAKKSSKETFLAKFSSVIASVDLCKAGVCNISKLDDETNSELGLYYFYGYGGNTVISTDYYDKKLRVHKIDDVINALELDTNCKNPYRRFTTALALLRSISADYENPLVLFYAH